MGNLKNDISYGGHNSAIYKIALRDMLVGMRFTHALTLRWNRVVSVASRFEHLKSLHARVDRRLIGKQFHAASKTERSLAIFPFEGSDVSVHCHSLWRIAPTNMLAFARLFPGKRGGVWNGIVPGGDYMLDILSDPVEAVGYVCKAQHLASECDSLIWSDEFLRP